MIAGSNCLADALQRGHVDSVFSMTDAICIDAVRIEGPSDLACRCFD